MKPSQKLKDILINSTLSRRDQNKFYALYSKATEEQLFELLEIINDPKQLEQFNEIIKLKNWALRRGNKDALQSVLKAEATFINEVYK